MGVLGDMEDLGGMEDLGDVEHRGVSMVHLENSGVKEVAVHLEAEVHGDQPLNLDLHSQKQHLHLPNQRLPQLPRHQSLLQGI